MKPILFQGAATALVTPFDENDRLDLPLLGKLIERQIENGISAIVLCATTGESPTINETEYQTAIRFAVKKSAGRIPVIASAGSNDTKKAVQKAILAKDSGANAVLSVTPYYNKPTQEGLIRHYFQIADRVDIPIILYNVPTRTGGNIEPETYQKLSEHKNIIATKEANPDLSAMIRTLHLCKENLTLYSGDDSLIHPVIASGGKGVISVAANLYPQKISKLCRLSLENRNREAAALQQNLAELNRALFRESNPIPIKKALEIAGFPVGSCRSPLGEANQETAEALKTIMESL